MVWLTPWVAKWWLGIVDHMKPLSLIDLICESRFGLNKFNWKFWLSGFAKVDPNLWSESGTRFILYGGYGLALIWSTIGHHNWLLLCSLNPGISPLFESSYFSSRLSLSPTLNQPIFPSLPQSLYLRLNLNLHGLNPWTITRNHYTISGVRVL